MCTHILPFLISMSGVPCKSRIAMVTNCHPEIGLFWYQLLPNLLHMMSTLCSSSSLIPYDIFSHLRQFKTFRIPWMRNRIIIFLIINLCCSQIIVSLPTIIHYHFINIKTWFLLLGCFSCMLSGPLEASYILLNIHIHY